MDAAPVFGAALLLVLLAALAYVRFRHRDLGSSADRATFATLHTASLAAPGLREGLTAHGAERAVRHLRALLGAAAVALVDGEQRLAADPRPHSGAHEHTDQAMAHAAEALGSGRTDVRRDVSCGAPDCPVRTAVVSPLVDGDTVVGAVIAYSRDASAMRVRAVEEVAAWVSGQIEIASAEAQRTRLIEAELRALRAQISPHFVYNSLTAIASFMRTDPGRARELLLEFADFTRYALRRGGEFTTLADELRNTERYLVLEQARFGDRLRVTVVVAPEVLPVSVPFLAIQPLVENAVKHGLEGTAGTVTVSIVAADAGAEALITIEDDGTGADPELIRRALEDADGTRRSIGLGNVDARLRHVYGDDYGLVVETAPGAGTKVSLRIPKFAPGVVAG